MSRSMATVMGLSDVEGERRGDGDDHDEDEIGMERETTVRPGGCLWKTIKKKIKKKVTFQGNCLSVSRTWRMSNIFRICVCC